MQEILLGVHREIIDARHDRVVARDVDLVVYDAAGVADELPANHELVLDVVAERVAHTAVPAGTAGAGADGPKQARLLIPFDPGHRPDRHDQVDLRHQLFIG